MVAHEKAVSGGNIAQWCMAMFIAIPLLYVLSALPMAIIFNALDMGWDEWEAIYAPLVWLSERNRVVGTVFD
jgi:hypothetical protein